MPESRKLSLKEAMELAVAQARQGLGFVAPNPPVGCVILDKQGVFLSQGYHAACGADHAEVDALNKITDPAQLEGAQVVVTLEPCAHEGRTSSCAKTLACYPVGEVIYGLTDPHPQVSGKGHDILKQAGIPVRRLEGFESQLEELMEVFLCNEREQRAFAALKVATSLDGHMALTNGQSQWITNKPARAHAHYLRGLFDAVLVGAQTLKLDDPKLNPRQPPFEEKINKVVVLDPYGSCLAGLKNAQVLKARPPENVYFIVASGFSQESPEGCCVLSCSYSNSRGFELKEVLRRLFEQGICSVFVEGGARVFASFLEQSAADRLYQFMAPVILGGGRGVNWTGELVIKDLSHKQKLTGVTYKTLEDNILITGRL